MFGIHLRQSRSQRKASGVHQAVQPREAIILIHLVLELGHKPMQGEQIMDLEEDYLKNGEVAEEAVVAELQEQENHQQEVEEEGPTKNLGSPQKRRRKRRRHTLSTYTPTALALTLIS